MFSHSFFQWWFHVSADFKGFAMLWVCRWPPGLVQGRVMVYVIFQFSVPCSASLDIGNACGSLRLSLGLCWLIHRILGSLAEISAIRPSCHIPLYWFLCPERRGFSVLLQVTGPALRRCCKRQEKGKNNVNSPHSLSTIRMAFFCLSLSTSHCTTEYLSMYFSFAVAFNMTNNWIENQKRI